jgi:hypothetical protein
MCLSTTVPLIHSPALQKHPAEPRRNYIVGFSNSPSSEDTLSLPGAVLLLPPLKDRKQERREGRQEKGKQSGMQGGLVRKEEE